ncbi:hypothetical protein FRC10_009010 [Ceratobasidium sp. 414]|nr:hypothetical protein FRC10_009010 [Ceratobasidium sp. 414]
MACCPGHTAAPAADSSFDWVSPAPAEATSTPAWSSSFTTTNVAAGLPDGYWVEAFPFRTKPHPNEGPIGPELIGYGLGVKEGDTIKQSEVRMYLNPYTTKRGWRPRGQIPPSWENTLIGRFDFAVALTYGNFRPKSGLNDIILCHDYGESMDKLNEEGGIVSYLKNPGNASTPFWHKTEIGRFPAMHRLTHVNLAPTWSFAASRLMASIAGYFTQDKYLEVMALPIMIKSKDRESPAPVIIYTPCEWEEDETPKKWQTFQPLDDTFRLIHDVQIIHSTTGGLDKALFAGREGISLAWKDEKSQKWRHENVGTGIPQSRKPFKNPYWGSGSVATARVGRDSVGYIATCEKLAFDLFIKAFHGNLVSVYVKPPGTRKDQIVTNEHWRRFVIDDFGPLKKGEYLDGSGVDSIIVACMGYPANMGTYVYKPLDLQRGLFARFKISDASAGRIAIADFRCSGTLDVATISYSVPNYLVTPNPALRLMLNNTEQTRNKIKAQRLGDEVMIRVPRAASADHTSEMPFLDIAGKRLSIVVLPPHREYILNEGFKYQDCDYQKDGVKIINGELIWSLYNMEHRRGINVPAKTATSMITDADWNRVRAGPNGAIFVRLASSTATGLPGLKFELMDDVATVNTLPFNVDPEARDMVFPWVKCSDREWGRNSPIGFNWPFYNLVGYHILYDDDSLTNFCHIQAWTLGVGETAAFHNHSDKSFCEIHACISNGTGQGGMYWAKDNEGSEKFLEDNKAEKDLEKLSDHTEMVIVGDMEEHGPLWRTTETGLPSLRPNDTVDYPYHAWLAGPKQDQQAYDVWLAFEFPSSEFQTGVSKYNGCASCT